MPHKTKHATPVKHAAPHRAVKPPPDVQADRPCPCASEDTIRLHAYRKWEAAGHPPGDGVAFWLEAENELKHPETMITEASPSA